MDPVAFQLGPLTVHWYGIFVVVGAVLGGLLASREAKRKGLNPDHVWNMLVWLMLFGIVGARLYHVFSSPSGGFTGWDYYRENPIEIIRIWRNGQLVGLSGLGIYGGVIGGALGVFIYTRIAKISFLQWADIMVIAVLLAQAIGRWGNFMNQELYGPPTTLPWGISIDCAHRYGDFLCPPQGTVAADARFHPTFLYESLWNFAGVALLLWISHRFQDRLRTGDVMLMYLIYYPLGRFWIELLFRPDAWVIGSLPTASLISIISIIIGIVGIVINHRLRRPQPAA